MSNGYGEWRYRHANPREDEWPRDLQRVLLTIQTYDPKRIDVVMGAYFEDEGWIIDYAEEYGDFDVLAWMPVPEPWGGGNK